MLVYQRVTSDSHRPLGASLAFRWVLRRMTLHAFCWSTLSRGLVPMGSKWAWPNILYTWMYIHIYIYICCLYIWLFIETNVTMIDTQIEWFHSVPCPKWSVFIGSSLGGRKIFVYLFFSDRPHSIITHICIYIYIYIHTWSFNWANFSAQPWFCICISSFERF